MELLAGLSAERVGEAAMKGVVLAGGMGTRMLPLTQEDNKHLLPVYKRRMVEYPLLTLVDAGITDIVLVTGGKRPGAFLELLRNGKGLGIDRLNYAYQEGSGGIADALKLASNYIPFGEPCTVILGDNYFEDGILGGVSEWAKRGRGAHVFLKETDRPWDFGIAEVDFRVGVISIEEKPIDPKSNMAILGVYIFDYSVWERIKEVKPSSRGELEITDLLKFYMNTAELSYSLYSGFWSDMGSFESWSEVSARIAGMLNV